VAIIAHVDHGKTSLVDKLLTVAGSAVKGERVMVRFI
jgi:predicted membrane GTPase involved in stress response